MSSTRDLMRKVHHWNSSIVQRSFFKINSNFHFFAQELLDFVREEILNIQRRINTDERERKKIMCRIGQEESGVKESHETEYVKYDPSLPPYMAYQIDFELYRIIYGALSPWGKGCQAEEIAARIFRVRFCHIFIQKKNS